MPQRTLPSGLRMTPRQVWRFIFQPQDYYSWLRTKFGNVVKLLAPSEKLIMTMNAKGAQQILKGHPDHYETFQKEAFTGIMGKGSIFVMEGKDHLRERQTLMPSFQRQYVRHYADLIYSIITEHTQNWISGQDIRAEETTLAISRDVIMAVVFGQDFERYKLEGRQQLARMLAVEHPVLFYVHQSQAWWSPLWRKYRRVKKPFFGFLARVVAERRASGNTGQDVLGRLMAARDEYGTPKSNAEIYDELYSILLPGHATTGVAIAWALFELSRHPEVLFKLREEIDALGPVPDLVLLAKLPYLDAVCNESMRLHTIVTETARRVQSPLNLLSYAIPAGYGIGISIIAVHHDPEIYPNPNQFRPERFIEHNFGPYEFLPFGGGHRRCLGAALSDFEMRLTIALLASKWDFELLQEEEEIRHNLGMGSKYGVRLRISPRLA